MESTPLRSFSKRSVPRLALLCAIALLGIIGCEDATTPGTNTPDAALTAQENTIRDAAQAMQTRGKGASVTVLDDGGTPFVKLTTDGSAITASVPLDWVNDGELAAARTLFSDAGATRAQLPNRNTTDLFPSLSVSLGDDPETAARFTADLLEQVYALAPQEELVFETEDD